MSAAPPSCPPSIHARPEHRELGLTVGGRLSILLLLLSAVRLLRLLSVLLLLRRRRRSARQRRASSRGRRRRSASCASLSGGEFTSETHFVRMQ